MCCRSSPLWAISAGSASLGQVTAFHQVEAKSARGPSNRGQRTCTFAMARRGCGVEPKRPACREPAKGRHAADAFNREANARRGREPPHPLFYCNYESLIYYAAGAVRVGQSLALTACPLGDHGCCPAELLTLNAWCRRRLAEALKTGAAREPVGTASSLGDLPRKPCLSGSAVPRLRPRPGHRAEPAGPAEVAAEGPHPLRDTAAKPQTCYAPRAWCSNGGRGQGTQARTCSPRDRRVAGPRVC